MGLLIKPDIAADKNIARSEMNIPQVHFEFLKRNLLTPFLTISKNNKRKNIKPNIPLSK